MCAVDSIYQPLTVAWDGVLLVWQPMCVPIYLCMTDTGIPFFSQLSLQVPPQAGMLLPGAFMRASQPYRQPSSVAQPVQTTPVGSPQTQVCVWCGWGWVVDLCWVAQYELCNRHIIRSNM